MTSDWKTPHGRLREAGAREILRLRAEGWTLDTIAKQLDVSVTTVFNVCHGLAWSWLQKSATST